MQNNIRNFSIIAHIDHGKSTLADRLLEITNTVEKRKMKEQVLDQMELERERGITIKMQPVRMNYFLQSTPYILNLIDTPGHIDFSYEVSRALKAVEGTILLVDATQGVQAQTITTVEMAKEIGLTIIPVLNKIDLPSARVEETKEEIRRLLQIDTHAILAISAKTGESIKELLEEIVKRIPPPKPEYTDRPRALIFDFEYSNHQGVIVYARITDGVIKQGDKLYFSQSKKTFIAGEIGVFSPSRVATDELKAGEIGYIVTSIKEPSVATVGDAITASENPLPALAGYQESKPVVWASVYPESQDNFTGLKQALERLKLSDSSISFEEETSGALGRGFRCGFLGMLHLEIITERLRREFGLELVITSPTVTYKVEFVDTSKGKGGEKIIYSPAFFPDTHLIKKLHEPWVDLQIITPPEYLGGVMQILYSHEAEIGETEQFGGNRTMLNVKMSLRELMRNFFDDLKSTTSGYASLNYKVAGMREVQPGDIVRLDILVAEEVVPAFSRIVSRKKIEADAKEIVEKLKGLIPRALFVIKIQAYGLGRILASRSISAIKKDVTGYLYGGDISRKKKLWEKQKKGKKKRQAFAKVDLPQDVFIKMMKK
jgi:GTP-binding protein LepA